MRLVAARVGPAARAVARWARTALMPALLLTASTLGLLARRGWARLRPALAGGWRRIRPALQAGWARLRPAIGGSASRLRATAAAGWARLDARARAGVLGSAGLLVVVAVTLATLGRGGSLVPVPSAPSSAPPSAGPAATLNPAQIDALLAGVLPTPSTIDTVLLVKDAAGLDATEQGWLNDLRKQLGNVEPLAYRDATLDRLRKYFVVFVIDRSADLDPKSLAAAYAAGLTVHLIGPAASYQAQVAAGVP